MRDSAEKKVKPIIAQLPYTNREEARLMVVKRNKLPLEYEDKQFKDLPHFLRKGDVIVLNSTSVIPARLILHKKTGGFVKILFVKEIEHSNGKYICECLAEKIKSGDVLFSQDKKLKCTVIERKKTGRWLVEFEIDDFWKYLEQHGKMPLPPYIKRNFKDEKIDNLDKEYYQTVFKKEGRSIAAPTAGLHFTDSLLEEIRNLGVEVIFIRLDIGIATFKTFKSADSYNENLEAEYFEVKKEAMKKIVDSKKNGQRIIAVGTTVVRTLEWLVRQRLDFENDLSGFTELFIKPPFEFKCVDALITNFHLPNGTPILLTYAFAGTDTVKSAYEKASELGYKFYSYGDATMFL